MTQQHAYQVAVETAVQRAHALAKALLSRPATLHVCDELLVSPNRLGLFFLRNNRRACRPEVVLEMVRRSYALRLASPPKALALARLACRLARPAATFRSRSGPARRALGDSMANLGNLLRVSERFWLAELLLCRASVLLEEVGEPSSRALCQEFLGSLRLDQRRPSEARGHFEAALAIHTRVQDEEGQARSRMLRAMSCYNSCEPAIALDELRAAAGLLDLPRHPQLALYILHLRALCLEAAGQPELSFQLVEQAEDFYRAEASETVWLRGRWLKGRLLLGQGEAEQAAVLFEEARRGFLAQKLPYDASLVTLDLSLAYLELGRASVVATLAREMAAVFTAKKVPQEAAAALLLFSKAALDFQADTALVAHLVAELSPERRQRRR